MEERFDLNAHQSRVAGAFRHHHIIWISLLYCITGIAEATSNYLMPDAIHRFTENAFIISIILSLNPFFGFVAQPLAGWYSDRIWTRIGRRKPVILFGAICLAVSCLGLPWSKSLAVLAFWILIYQFMVDAVSIMLRSFIGDVIPPGHRSKAFGTGEGVISSCMIFATMFWGSKLVGAREWQWYAVVAAVALLATLPATFLVKEHYIPVMKKQGGSLSLYLQTALRTPYSLRICLVIAFTFVAGQLVMNYYRLFTKEQLGLDPEQALKPFSWMPIITLVASMPVAYICDRFRLYKSMTLTGALLVAGAGLTGVFATSSTHLMAMAILMGLSVVCMAVGLNAYTLSFMPPDKIGQLSGFQNIFRGGPRFIMFFATGFLVEQFSRNYRIAFAGAIVCVIVAVLILLPMPREGAYAREAAAAPKDGSSEPNLAEATAERPHS